MRERIWILGLLDTTGAGQQLEPLTKLWIYACTHARTHTLLTKGSLSPRFKYSTSALAQISYLCKAAPYK